MQPNRPFAFWAPLQLRMQLRSFSRPACRRGWPTGRQLQHESRYADWSQTIASTLAPARGVAHSPATINFRQR